MNTLISQIIYQCLNNQYEQNYNSVDECLNDVIEAYKVSQSIHDQSTEVRACDEEMKYLRYVNATILVVLIFVTGLFIYSQRQKIWNECCAAFIVLKQLNTFNTAGRPRNLISDVLEKDNAEAVFGRDGLNEPENQQPGAPIQQPVIANEEPVVPERQAVTPIQRPLVANEESVVQNQQPVTTNQRPAVSNQQSNQQSLIPTINRSVISSQETILEPENQGKHLYFKF